MGLFDGILLCSDFDGTLAVAGEVSRENADAVRYFQSEGGWFTFATGRYPDHFDALRPVLQPNAPLVALNGCLIAATDGTVLQRRYLPEESREAAYGFLQRFPYLSEVLLHPEAGMPIVTVPRDEYDPAEAARTWGPLYKILFRTPAELAGITCRQLNETAGSLYGFCRSYDTAIEMQNVRSDKGRGARFAAQYLGARYLVGVGDYENDLPLLYAADYSYAVGDGLPEVRAAADAVTVPCAQHAVAAVIEDLAHRCAAGLL